MTVTVAAGEGVGTTTPFFLGEDDAPNSLTFSAKKVQIGVGSGVSSAKATQLTIVGNDTGATSSITITNNVTLNSLVKHSGA
jgi:hypothetical protein